MFYSSEMNICRSTVLAYIKCNKKSRRSQKNVWLSVTMLLLLCLTFLIKIDSIQWRKWFSYFYCAFAILWRFGLDNRRMWSNWRMPIIYTYEYDEINRKEQFLRITFLHFLFHWLIFFGADSKTIWRPEKVQ